MNKPADKQDDTPEPYEPERKKFTVPTHDHKGNPECIKAGECSWFRHSQDFFRKASTAGNYPQNMRSYE